MNDRDDDERLDDATEARSAPRLPAVRAAARLRQPLDGADAQALEAALSLTERERDEARAEADLDAAEAAHRYHGRVVAERNGWRMRAEDLASQLDEARRERDELKSRLAHAEADAEQAIHNEAFMERQRIAEWLRTASRARGVLISIHSSQDIARCADAIERGEHEQ